jgi:hypothetical protein
MIIPRIKHEIFSLFTLIPMQEGEGRCAHKPLKKSIKEG